MRVLLALTILFATSAAADFSETTSSSSHLLNAYNENDAK